VVDKLAAELTNGRSLGIVLRDAGQNDERPRRMIAAE
jgi:hypothetical protein